MGVNEDLWKAASNGNLADFQRYLQKGGNVACKVNDKTCLQIATKNLELQVRINDTVKAEAYRAVIACLRTELNMKVVEAAKQGSADQLCDLHIAGGDLYQPGPNVARIGIIQLAASSQDDQKAKAAVELILEKDPRNNLEGITYSCSSDENILYGIHTLANSKGNTTTSVYLHQKLTCLLMNCPKEKDGIRKLQRLSAMGIDVNHVDQDGNTVLFLAIEKRNFEMVQELVENLNAKLTLKMTERDNEERKDKSVVDVCKGLDPREPNLEKYLKSIIVNEELLSSIKEKGKRLGLQELKQKLVQGFNPNYCDKEGNTSLMLAIALGCPSGCIKEIVLSYSTDLEVVNKKGYRALEIAILSTNSVSVDETLNTELGVEREVNTILELIILLGADLKRKGRTLLEFAKACNKPRAVKILKEALEEKLVKALLDGDIKNVTELVTCGIDINVKFQLVKDEYAKGRKGWTPLQIAVDRGNVHMIKTLCEWGANLNECIDTRTWSGTALSLACKKGDRNGAQQLLELGANIQLKDDNEDGNTPLITAVKSNQSDIVHLLLYYGADETKQNNKGASAADLAKDSVIHTVFEKLNLGKVSKKCAALQLELKDDFCPPVTLPDLRIPAIRIKLVGDRKMGEKLLSAAENGNWIDVEKALHAGADIRYRNDDGKNGPALALHFKYEKQLLERLNPFLKDDEQTNLKRRERYQTVVDKFNVRATYMLWDAVENETLERVQTLHAFGADITSARDTQDPIGVPGMLVRNQDNPDILNYVVEADIAREKKNYNAILKRNDQNESCLSIAKLKGHSRCAKYLVARLSQNLNECVSENDFERCEYFIKLGAVPDIHKIGEESPKSSILCAIANGNFKIVKLLVEAGSDMKIISDELLEELKNKEMVSYLNTKRLSQFLREAVHQGNLQEVKKFHQIGGRINDRNYRGYTSVDIAVETGNLPIVHYLLSRGGSIIRKKQDAGSNMRQAELIGNKDMVNYLHTVATERFEQALIRGNLDELDQLLAMPNFTIADHKINGETPATLAVKHHGIDLIKCLWKKNMPLDKPNANGDYPLGLAAANGDYAVVSFLVKECKLNKNVKNVEGETPLQLAESAGWNMISEFLSTGRIVKQKEKEDQPKRNLSELRKAVLKGKTGIIKQFVAEKYQNRKQKIYCCQIMISEAESHQAEEIRVMLQKHLMELQEDTSDFKLTGSKNSQKILDGFLDAMEKLLAGIKKDGDFRTVAEATMLYRDVDELQNDISGIREQLEIYVQGTGERKRELNKKLDEMFDNLDPSERIMMRNEIKNLKQQVKTADDALRLLDRKQRTVTEKQKAIQIFKRNKEQQYMFFETICTKIDTYLFNIKVM